MGCMEAITSSPASRATSSACSTCTCSIRWRKNGRPASRSSRRTSASTSRMLRLARSPMACTLTASPERLACSACSSISSLSIVETPQLSGSSR